MSIFKIIKSRILVTDIMENLQVKRPEEGILPFAGHSFCATSAALEDIVKFGEFMLIIGKESLALSRNLLANECALFERPALWLPNCDPSAAMTALLSLISGANSVDLKAHRVAALLFPNVRQAAEDLFVAPLQVIAAKSLTLQDLDKLAAKMVKQGLREVFLENILSLHIRPRERSSMSDLPTICQSLMKTARRHDLTVYAGLDTTDFSVVAPADVVVRAEKLSGDCARLGVKRGSGQPRFDLVRQEPCGRFSAHRQYPWDFSTGRHFAKAMRGMD